MLCRPALPDTAVPTSSTTPLLPLCGCVMTRLTACGVRTHALLHWGVPQHAPGSPNVASFCRWPFWVGFGVTGGLILKLSLSLTGAQACADRPH